MSKTKVSMGTVQNGWIITARVQAAVLNIILTILHQKAEWSKDGLNQFIDEYTIMLRQYRDKGQIGKQIRQAVEETKARMDIHLTVNKDIPDTRQNRLVEKTWRESLMVGLTVLKQCNTKDALWAVVDHFSDFMDALTDARHGVFEQAVYTNSVSCGHDEEAMERQEACLELLTETMRYLGRSSVG